MGEHNMATIQTIDDWIAEAERLRVQYVTDTRKLRERLGRLVDEGKRDNLWAGPIQDVSQKRPA